MASCCPTILVIDDEPEVLRFLERILLTLSFDVTTASNGQDGLEKYIQKPFELVLLDLRMPFMDGFEFLEHVKSQNIQASVVVLTAYGSPESAVQALQMGAVDYLTKPISVTHLNSVLQKVLAKHRARNEKQPLLSIDGLIGQSPEMQKIYEAILRVSATITTVLIEGETGVGKELAARAIHTLGPRCHEPFVPINCGALPENLLESELFGYEIGAFTDAVRQKLGLIEKAHGGTLFLDEVEEMSPALQVKLLRTIQEREVLHIGGTNHIPVDFRLISASNVHLRKHIANGTFREDLFYRLSVVHIVMPPLRDRRKDIPLLVQHFVQHYAQKNGVAPPAVERGAMMILQAYDWPGNVRELENTIEQTMLFGSGEVISAGDLPTHIVSSPLDAPKTKTEPNPGEMTLHEFRRQNERHYLVYVLKQAGGSVAKAAQIAGISSRHFYEKIKQYGIAISEKDNR